MEHPQRRHGAAQMTFWTVERAETLRRMWKRGKTSRQIAERLGGDCTRN